MSKPSKGTRKSELLFDLGEPRPKPFQVARLKRPVWTENKAKLIELYLKHFVYVTKHGTYIDGFAGPQEERDDVEMWSARLVLQSTPKRLRHFYLFDANPKQVERLQRLRAQELPLRERNNTISVEHGDFNVKVRELLDSRRILPTEATFCLLDQRTFECHWSTVQSLARYKPTGYKKVEQFYFYPQGWIARSISALKDEQKLRDWWGRDDVDTLRQADSKMRLDLFVDRFKDELNYTYVAPWPIWDREGGQRVMYYMIHASDHPEATPLMSRAYRKAVDPVEPIEQLELAIEEELATVRGGS